MSVDELVAAFKEIRNEAVVEAAKIEAYRDGNKATIDRLEYIAWVASDALTRLSVREEA